MLPKGSAPGMSIGWWGLWRGGDPEHTGETICFSAGVKNLGILSKELEEMAGESSV